MARRKQPDGRAHRQKAIESELVRAPIVSRGVGPKVEILGVYSLPLAPWYHLVEARIPWPSGRVGARTFAARSFLVEEPWDWATAVFFLDAAGEILLGYESGWCLDRPQGISPTRAAFLFVGGVFPGRLRTPGGWVDAGEPEPVPDRLLRLIWLEE